MPIILVSGLTAPRPMLVSLRDAIRQDFASVPGIGLRPDQVFPRFPREQLAIDDDVVFAIVAAFFPQDGRTAQVRDLAYQGLADRLFAFVVEHEPRRGRVLVFPNPLYNPHECGFQIRERVAPSQTR